MTTNDTTAADQTPITPPPIKAVPPASELTLAEALSMKDMRPLAMALSKELAADPSIFAPLVKDITLSVVATYSAVARMERGYRVFGMFQQAGIRLSLNKDGALVVDPVARLTPALSALLEIEGHELRSHVLNMREAARYRQYLEAELWPHKPHLGLLAELRSAGLRATLGEDGVLRAGPSTKLTAAWRRYIRSNRADLVRELMAEQRTLVTGSDGAANGTA